MDMPIFQRTLQKTAVLDKKCIQQDKYQIPAQFRTAQYVYKKILAINVLQETMLNKIIS